MQSLLQQSHYHRREICYVTFIGKKTRQFQIPNLKFLKQCIKSEHSNITGSHFKNNLKYRKTHSRQLIQSPACGLTLTQVLLLYTGLLVLLLGSCTCVELSFLFFKPNYETQLKKCSKQSENLTLNVCRICQPLFCCG